MERVVDLAQGLEWTGPVHVVATHIYGRGKFYVAVTRCRDLRMLKISGIDGYATRQPAACRQVKLARD